MNALPQGVTLEPSTTPGHDHSVHRVMRGATTLGEVWSAKIADAPQAHYAAPGTVPDEDARWRLLPTREAAVRWVCLQARPVVYQVRQVRPVRDAGGLIGWNVTRSGLAGAVAMMGPAESSRVLALSIAHAMARTAARDLEARA